MIRIDTIEHFRKARASIEPVYITSRTKGRIRVPCMTTLLVRVELVIENLYNPNAVAPDKMKLLEQSILDNGVCFPVVTIWDDEQERFVVIDGAHRRMIHGADWLDCDYIPVVVLDHDMSARLAATWQFNKARGVHRVDLDAELIRKLINQGETDESIAERFKVSVDDVFRYRQVAGIAEIRGKNAQWSGAWEMADDESAR